MIFFVERLRDFLLRSCVIFFGGCMFFCVVRLHDFFVERLHDFYFAERLHDFFVERLHDFCHSLRLNDLFL